MQQKVVFTSAGALIGVIAFSIPWGACYARTNLGTLLSMEDAIAIGAFSSLGLAIVFGGVGYTISLYKNPIKISQPNGPNSAPDCLTNTFFANIVSTISNKIHYNSACDLVTGNVDAFDYAYRHTFYFESQTATKALNKLNLIGNDIDISYVVYDKIGHKVAISDIIQSHRQRLNAAPNNTVITELYRLVDGIALKLQYNTIQEGDTIFFAFSVRLLKGFNNKTHLIHMEEGEPKDIVAKFGTVR